MGKTVLIYVLGTLSVFVIFNLNINKTLLDESSSSYSYYAETEARNIGNTMVEMLTSELSDSVQFRVTSPATKNFFGGQANYTVIDTVVAPDSMVKISVTATYFGQTKRMISLMKKPGGGNQVPAAFTYALLSGDDLQMSGNATVQDDGNSAWNANVHTNGEMEMSGNALIKGFLSYPEEFQQSGHARVQPNQNPQNLPTNGNIPANVPVPTFNPDNYKSKATQTYSGNFSQNNGTITLGTAANPAIIYVGGDFNLSGNVTISGYGIIVVKGDTQLSGNVTFQTKDPNTSTFSLYGVGDIKMSGNSDLYGQFLSLSDVQMSGNGSIHGSITSAGEFQNSGNGKILYRPANSKLTSPIFGGSGQQSTRPLKATSYYE